MFLLRFLRLFPPFIQGRWSSHAVVLYCCRSRLAPPVPSLSSLLLSNASIFSLTFLFPCSCNLLLHSPGRVVLASRHYLSVALHSLSLFHVFSFTLVLPCCSPVMLIYMFVPSCQHHHPPQHSHLGSICLVLLFQLLIRLIREICYHAEGNHAWEYK